MGAEKPSSLPSEGQETFKLNLHEDSFSGYLLNELPSLEVETSKDQLVELYRQMTTMRRMEQAADQLYKAKLIRGFCHLAIGQVSLFIYLFSSSITTNMFFFNILSPFRKLLLLVWKLL